MLRRTLSDGRISEIFRKSTPAGRQPGAFRLYSCTSVVQEENAAEVDRRAVVKQAAKEYASRQVVYRKQVSVLRKQYAAEVKRQRQTDQAEEEAKRKEQTRRKLERQRAKNIRSALHATLQREKQELRRKEFEEELRIAQINRDARNQRFAKARQLLIDELEEEAPLWLTTPEEVEAAFTPEAEQLLWARPHSVLGAPTPTEDAEFWRYQSQSPYKGRTYPLARELLLEELEEAAYMESNMMSSFWTEERLGERDELEEKARLRAMVYDAGRRALLKKQQELLQGRFSEEESKTKIPQPMPVPNVKILANNEAMEAEGVDLLLRDPTQFFEFEGRQSQNDDSTEADEDTDDASYQGPSLGVPVGLKRSIAFPTIVGKLPKADTRTESQKKREEREKKMLEAARAASGEDEDDLDLFDVSKMPSDSTVHYDSDDERWIEERGLAPGDDPDLVAMPYGLQYKNEDVDWVVSQLENKVASLNEQLRVEVNTAQKEARALEERQGKTGDGAPQLDSSVHTALRDAGVDVDKYESVLASLTADEMTELMLMSDTGMSTPLDEVRERLHQAIPGLSDHQLDVMMEVEETLRGNAELRAVLNIEKEDASLVVDDDDGELND